jgi:hypothetical protein
MLSSERLEDLDGEDGVLLGGGLQQIARAAHRSW